MGSEFVRRKSSVRAKKSDTKPSLFTSRPFSAPTHEDETVNKKELPKEVPQPDYIFSNIGVNAPQPTVQRELESPEEKEPEQEVNLSGSSDSPIVDEGEKEETLSPSLEDGEKKEDLGNQSVQTKLTVGEPGDKYEQEADTVAAKVVEQINSPKIEQPVQGKVEPVVKPTVMRQGGAAGGTVNRDVEQNIQQARGGGQGLNDNVRQPMEQAFGADFSGVKVHTGGQADTLNRSLNSRAFATGQDIFFKQGEYNPGSKQGQELLAHELTHVVQQKMGKENHGKVQRQTAQNIKTNAIDLTGKNKNGDFIYDNRSINRIQIRLIELGYLNQKSPGFVWGKMTETTLDALKKFQKKNKDKIAQIVDDSQELDDLTKIKRGKVPKSQYEFGKMSPNDATHQALANSWPRTFFNKKIKNQEQAYSFIAKAVKSRGLPFDSSRVNIVGIRGYQGGNVHENAGIRRRNNRYDDSFFILALDENGKPMLREFRGTTDPGGRSPEKGGPKKGEQDRRTHVMEANQQIRYRFYYGKSNKFDRPQLSQQEDLLTKHGVKGDMKKKIGIAIHSGGGTDKVNADSTGCQVIHGDWYGSFIQTLRRALTWERIRKKDVDRVLDDPEKLEKKGDVLYSLLDGRDLEEKQDL